MRTYQEILPLSRKEAETLFSTNSASDETVICETLIRLAYHDSDWQWVQNWCLHFTTDKRSSVRATAVLCLGHLARIHGRLELKKVNRVLRKLLHDAEIKWRVEEVLEDLAMFVEDKPPIRITPVKKAA